MKVFNEWLETHPEEKLKCDDVTSKYKTEQTNFQEEQNTAKLKYVVFHMLFINIVHMMQYNLILFTIYI